MTKQPNIEKTDVLGIVSIVMAFMSLQIPGLIIGLVGVSKAEKEGRSPKLSKIGWILNLAFLIVAVLSIAIFFALIPSHRNSVDDLGRKADLKYFSNQLEEFHSRTGHYPPTLDQFVVSTIDTKDSDGNSYVYTPAPNGCTECTGYKLQTKLEKAENGTKNYEIISQKK